ncbi:alpha-xenorhabdolysin family binary toxin subunit A [Shewanella sp. VB17]|uniref:alpha-xenorhabdolysin family binary toxin subunit A n=1 Tax=Shewanella sp. VB17 TaxID=2739432 RepID=UPI0015669214|nr:alpha-xenorhabdolysin family binary toxin subunit A [Shewanella sp. VB17]NRD71789.1 alpha-xenorhabdolysin family binary toxin subunit A [Shewanella sp. VB17]
MWQKIILAAICTFVLQGIAFAEQSHVLGNAEAFDIQNSDSILSKEEWIQLNMLARTASTLPISEDNMRKRFMMGDKVVFDGMYQELLQRYQDIHQISDTWLGELGYRDRMVALVGSLVDYAQGVTDTSSDIVSQANQLLAAAQTGNSEHFYQVKVLLLATLEAMLEDANQYYMDADNLGDGLTIFINNLEIQLVELSQLQSINSNILENDGSAASNQIDELKAQIDDLNREYRKWVKVSATTPTYAWIFPFGTIAAVSTAAAGTAQVLALKNQIKSIREDVTRLRQEMAQDQAVYLSWSIATDSIEKILDNGQSALMSQQKLRGGWAIIVSQLETVVEGVRHIDSEEVINNPNNVVAAALTQVNVNIVQQGWLNVLTAGQTWLANSDVTGVSSAQFSVPITSELADEFGVSYSTQVHEYATGLSWPTYDYQQATTLCHSQGMRLPTKFELVELQTWFNQYEDLDEHVWPVAIDYWSATIDPQGRYYTVGIDGGGTTRYPHGHQYVVCTSGETLNEPVSPPPQASAQFTLPLTKEEAEESGVAFTGYKAEVDFGPKWATFTYSQAKSMCESRGMLLPSSEELIQFAQDGIVGWPTHRDYWTQNNSDDDNWDYIVNIVWAEPIVFMKEWTAYGACKYR